MNILGISDVTGNHSHSCVAIMQENQLTFAVSQERTSRIKNDSRFPYEAIEHALDFTRLEIDDIDYFACAYPPANYYGSLLACNKLDLPRSLFGVLARKPISLAKYLFPNLRKGLFDPKNNNGLFDLGVQPEYFHFIDHHLAHISAGYFSSGFDQALAISYGGFAPHITGQNVAGAVYICQDDKITFVQDIPMFAAGCFFSGITVALGFTYMQQEGKTMGLAITGDQNVCYDELKKLCTTFEKNEWQRYANWIDYIMAPRSDAFLGTKSGSKLLQLISTYSAQDVAAAAQKIWQENIINFVTFLLKKYPLKNLVLSGGTFLNVQINRQLSRLEGVEAIFSHPHTGDGSTTIGAMIELHRKVAGNPPRLSSNTVGLGCEYSDKQIEKCLMSFKDISYQKLNNISEHVAAELAKEKVIAWFQGREEYGPRSLGFRCILADPRNNNMRLKINKVKNRESWIPIAPSLLAEHGHTYFSDFFQSPYMTRVFTVRQDKKEIIPAALHSDGSSRAQSLDKNSFAPFRLLVEKFYELTGIPMVLNTSLNRHAEPIIQNPHDAVKLLLSTKIDSLAIGSYFVTKKDKN